jgi:hypothetical protein
VHPRWEDIPLPEGMPRWPPEHKRRRSLQSLRVLLSLRSFMLTFRMYALLIDPPGRSLNSSKSAFEEMNRQTGFYQLHTSGPYSQQAPQAQMPPTNVPRKRQLPGSEILTPSFPAIQPRPLGLSPAPYTPIPPENAGSFRPSPGDSAGEPAKKRRGRPSNAQIEQEKATAAAEGREWQPRPPRPPRKKKSLPSKDSPPRDDAGPSQHLVPQTPGIQMGEAEEEGSSGKRRRRKAREETTVVRAAPYDPVRQSPAEAVPFTGEGHSSATPRPPETKIQPAADLNISPIDQHLMTKTHILSDKSQHLQTD